MKKIIYSGMFVFSVVVYTACDRRSTETGDTKQTGPVIELKEDVPVTKSDSTRLPSDSTARPK